MSVYVQCFVAGAAFGIPATKRLMMVTVQEVVTFQDQMLNFVLIEHPSQCGY